MKTKPSGKKRVILNDKQKRRLAILAKRVGRKVLFDISCVFSPNTLLAWYRKLVAAKYDGSRLAVNTVEQQYRMMPDSK